MLSFGVSFGLWVSLTSFTLGSISGCSAHQTNPQRVISATAQIEDPIRTLEARAELELLSPSPQASDELLISIIPDASAELLIGSPEYQRALTEPDQVLSLLGDRFEPEPTQREDIEPDRIALAIKLYTQARSLRQTGQGEEAIELLEQAARLDPGSSSVQREIGNTLVLSNDRAGALLAFERAITLGDRSPRAMVHLASHESSRGNHERVIWLSTQALQNRSINDHPMARSIAGVLLGIAQIESGFLKAGSQTLSDALDSFDTSSRDLRWKREIIEIMSQRSQLWIVTGDAWASMNAHHRAQEAYTKAGLGVDRPPTALIARQLASALRQGHPANASLLFLDHLQSNATDLSSQEHRWAKALGSIEGINDVLGGALSELGNHPRLPASVRRSLLSIEIETLDLDQGVLALSNAGLDADDPIVCLHLLSRIIDEHERYNASALILEHNPSISRSIASALSRTLAHPVEFFSKHRDPKTQAHELLIASLGIGLGRADLVEHLSSIPTHELDAYSAQWVGVHAQASALVGRWEESTALLNELIIRGADGSSDPSTDGLLASTLMVMQQPTRAWELIEPRANDADADLEDLLLGAKIAQRLEHFESAAAFLERASELDPYTESIYEQLFLLRSSGSPIGNEEDLRHVVRQLSTNRPRSALFTLIRANELARNGLIDESETLLRALNNDHPYSEIGYDLMLSIWKTWSTQGRPDALDDGIRWLESRLIDNPNSVETINRITQGLIELDQRDRALDLLNDGFTRTGSFELARLLEQLGYQQDDGSAIIGRLAELHGIDATIELASYHATRGTAQSSKLLLELLHSNLPTTIELLPAQSIQLAKVVFVLAESIESLNHETDLLDLISIIETRSPRLSFQLARIKILLLASLRELDMDELITSVNLAAANAETDEQRNMLKALPIQSLLGEDRPHEAIMLTARFATLTGKLDNDFGVEVFRLLAGAGTNADMLGVLDLLEEHGLMAQAIELTTTMLGTPDRAKPAITSDEQRADLIYTAAALSTAFERNEQASSYYELALSYDPDHAWSNNDYGYMLAENGDRMDYAVALLERAAKTLPNQASVIDSLAWVRYKMGIFDDVTDPQGVVLTRGAISLLMRANELDIKRENATIMLHLGDALWRGGYEQRANNAWIGAEDIARSRIRLINAQPNPNMNAIEAMSLELREIRYRIQDAESTGKPSIAPLAEGYQTIIPSDP